MLNINITNWISFDLTLKLFDPLAEIVNRKSRPQDVTEIHSKSDIVACWPDLRSIAKFLVDSISTAGERPNPWREFSVT